MRAALLTIGSLVLTAVVIGNAYYQKKQFYPSVVYITKSNPSMAVIYIQAFVLVLLMGKVMRKVFFGQLRAAEMEHLIERSWYAVTETCLAFTVFRDDFSPKFVALFTLLLFLKCFHWLAEDRVDYMERSPVISWLFHLRVISLLSLLGLLDYLFVSHAYHSTLTKGASVQLVFGFEYAILLTIIGNIFVKYILHTIDLQSENPWEDKAVYLLYTELVIGFLKVALYLSFMMIMIKIHTFPLFAIRPTYLSMRAFKKAFNDVIMSRRAIRNMNTLYPDATNEELATVDNVCIICREEMTGGGSSKKLPCNHIFHASCLRSWFQRQQTCPTCRMDVLRVPNAAAAAPAGGIPLGGGAQARDNLQRPANQQQQQNVQNPFQIPNWPGVVPGALPAPFPFLMPFHLPQQQGQQDAAAQPPPAAAAPSQPPRPPQDAQGTAPGTSAASGFVPAPGSTTQPSTSTEGAIPSSSSTTTVPPGPCLLPPFAFMPFFLPPPPLPSADLSGLTDEELRELEGQERENVEARIRCLRNIQTFLDAAVLQMQQYIMVMPTARKPDGTQLASSMPSSNSGGSSLAAQPPVSEGSGAAEASSSSSHSKSSSVPASAVNDRSPGAMSASENSMGEASNLSNPEGGAREAEGDMDVQEQLRRRRLQRFAVQEQNGKTTNGTGAVGERES